MSIIPPILTPPDDETDEPGSDTFQLVGVPLPSLSGNERSLPIRPPDLTRLLLAEPDLAPAERAQLTRLGKLLGAVFHHEFHAWLMELKELYAPLDPDSEYLPPRGRVEPVSSEADEAFLGPFEATLIRANFIPLDMPELEKSIETPNELGLDYVPDLGLFEHLRVYVRGQCRVTRVYRNAATLFRKRTVTYDAYRRVVIVLKFKPGADLDEYVRSDVLYLRMFKNVPYTEMDMHLPEHGTKVRMRWIDKLQIASPMMTGIPTLAAKLFFAASISPWLMGGVLIAPISAGVKSFFGFRAAKQRYLHYMIRHLYYLTLANNASVINRMIDAGEDEEFKEALLAYFLLWRGIDDPEPWDQARLDGRVEAFLFEKVGLEVNFEIGDALKKLFRFGLVQEDGQGKLHAVPIEVALPLLDELWHRYVDCT